MAQFAEEVLKEYPQLVKRKTWTKDVSYRIRVVRRKLDGIMRPLIDIREYIVSEKRALFTESGIYLTREELDKLIPILLNARKEFFNGAGTGSGSKDSIGIKKENKLP